VYYGGVDLEQTSMIINRLNSLKHRYMISHSATNTLNLVTFVKNNTLLKRNIIISKVYNSSTIILLNSTRYMINNNNIYVSHDGVSNLLLKDTPMTFIERESRVVEIRVKPSSKSILDSLVMNIIDR
jgi:hypothetical protein